MQNFEAEKAFVEVEKQKLNIIRELNNYFHLKTFCFRWRIKQINNNKSFKKFSRDNRRKTEKYEQSQSVV